MGIACGQALCIHAGIPALEGPQGCSQARVFLSRASMAQVEAWAGVEPRMKLTRVQFLQGISGTLPISDRILGECSPVILQRPQDL